MKLGTTLRDRVLLRIGVFKIGKTGALLSGRLFTEGSGSTVSWIGCKDSIFLGVDLFFVGVWRVDPMEDPIPDSASSSSECLDANNLRVRLVIF